MTKRTRSTEAVEELAEPVEEAGERVFDFTGPIAFDQMDAEDREVYYRLRRVAKMANDESRLPDGKTFTESQVIEILGEDYANGLVVDKKCCG